MIVLLLNLPYKYEIAVNAINSALGISNSIEGDSVNSLGAQYAETSLLGIKIKIEENSYEYEDDYNYTIFIDNDIFSTVKTTEHNINLVSKVIADLLYRNLETSVGIEINQKLEVYNGQ